MAFARVTTRHHTVSRYTSARHINGMSHRNQYKSTYTVWLFRWNNFRHFERITRRLINSMNLVNTVAPLRWQTISHWLDFMGKLIDKWLFELKLLWVRVKKWDLGEVVSVASKVCWWMPRNSRLKSRQSFLARGTVVERPLNGIMKTDWKLTIPLSIHLQAFKSDFSRADVGQDPAPKDDINLNSQSLLRVTFQNAKWMLISAETQNKLPN